MKPDPWHKSFVGEASRPAAWWHCALRLKRAADLLWTPIETNLRRLRDSSGPAHELDLDATLPYMMLTGLALECAVKGLLIRQKPALVREEKLPR